MTCEVFNLYSCVCIVLVFLLVRSYGCILPLCSQELLLGNASYMSIRLCVRKEQTEVTKVVLINSCESGQFKIIRRIKILVSDWGVYERYTNLNFEILDICD